MQSEYSSGQKYSWYLRFALLKIEIMVIWFVNLCSYFLPADGGSRFIHNIGNSLHNYMVS